MGVEGRFISQLLRHGLCELQCSDYFSALKPQAIGQSINKELEGHYLE